MYKIADFQVDEKVYVLPPERNIHEGREFLEIEAFVIRSVGEDRISAVSVDDEERMIEFIESVTYGVIVDNQQIKKSLVFKSEKEARDYYEQDIIEKWFRIQFSKLPQSDFTYEKIKEAQAILKEK